VLLVKVIAPIAVTPLAVLRSTHGLDPKKLKFVSGAVNVKTVSSTAKLPLVFAKLPSTHRCFAIL